MTLSAADQRKLLPLLDRLAEAVEELLLTGLTTASGATRQLLGVTFQEVSRLRLLRLGGTLRVANEEIGRFTTGDPAFSQRRLVFFLNRAWLLGKGLARALRERDESELARLLWTPPVEPLDELRVVTLGAVKKLAAGAFCSFEFRLRGVDDGRAYVWSTVFPLKPGVEIPPEGFLHIPQKQKFTASVFLERKTLALKDIAVARDESGTARIQLGEQSMVEAGEDFTDWQRFAAWEPAAALERVQNHQPGPFDLEVELQEDVVLADWTLGEAEGANREGWIAYPILHRGALFEARVSSGIDGKALRQSLEELQSKRQRPPLFGVLHYETCRLVVQPLSLLTDEGPQYLTISQESVDRRALLQTLKFT